MVSLITVSRNHPLEVAQTLQEADANRGDESVIPSQIEDWGASHSVSSSEGIILEKNDQRNDGWDDFNHPRKRRAMILQELYERQQQESCQNTTIGVRSCGIGAIFPSNSIVFREPTRGENSVKEDPLLLYRKVHSDGLIDFLTTAWFRWVALEDSGRDLSCVPMSFLLNDNEDCLSGNGEKDHPLVPPMIPCNFLLPREWGRSHHTQKPSKNVMGQIGYYCTDTCTPIFSELLAELEWDAHTVSTSVDLAIGKNECQATKDHSLTKSRPLVYALCTHPGHHAAKDSFGGYCYVNNAALAARLLQERLPVKEDSSPIAFKRIAILDVDYHCGNGSASIFYDDPSVLVVSIHCHPDYEYPFHSGYGDEIGNGEAEGTTLHLPLLPGATWRTDYEPILKEKAAAAIVNFCPDAFVLSLGLDTHINDPCATRRAGFQLRSTSGKKDVENAKCSDYYCMGTVIGAIINQCSSKGDVNEKTKNHTQIPAIVFQEGGYEMEAVPSAAADVLLGMTEAMSFNAEV